VAEAANLGAERDICSAVDIGSIKEIDAEIEGGLDRPDRFGIVGSAVEL
jgi:hypothetical protein